MEKAIQGARFDEVKQLFNKIIHMERFNQKFMRIQIIFIQAISSR